MASQQRGKAIYRVREINSPIHKQFRGLRVEVALPNMAGQKPFSDIPVPSFDKPYFICRFGDYESWEYLTRKWPSIWRALQKMGFEAVEQIKPEDFAEERPESESEVESAFTLEPTDNVETQSNPTSNNQDAQQSAHGDDTEPQE